MQSISTQILQTQPNRSTAGMQNNQIPLTHSPLEKLPSSLDIPTTHRSFARAHQNFRLRLQRCHKLKAEKMLTTQTTGLKPFQKPLKIQILPGTLSNLPQAQNKFRHTSQPHVNHPLAVHSSIRKCRTKIFPSLPHNFSQPKVGTKEKMHPLRKGRSLILSTRVFLRETEKKACREDKKGR